MQVSAVEVGGFADQHTHLLAAAAQVPFPWQELGVRAFHQQVARAGRTPMDVPEPDLGVPMAERAARLRAGLTEAALAGLTEITEMGIRSWWYLDALAQASAPGPLPARVRIYLASGLAEQATLAELDARRGDAGPWVRLDGIKFYADGWLVPRTCALCSDFTDGADRGVLFADAATLARRIEPLAGRGWRIATHAIGDRAVETVLEAYVLAWGRDAAAIAAAQPRIEHGSVVGAELAARIAALGVSVCLQPSFAVTDAPHVPVALGARRAASAYPWAALAAAGVPLLLGTDYPIEVLDPLAGLARLVHGRCDRPGVATGATAPESSRLPVGVAMDLACDDSAGRTTLSADPRACTAAELDQVEVLGTSPVPFAD